MFHVCTAAEQLCVSDTVHACYNKDIIYRSCTNTLTMSTHQSLRIYTPNIFLYQVWGQRERMRRCLPRFTPELRNGMQFTSKKSLKMSPAIFWLQTKNILLSRSQWYRLEEEAPARGVQSFTVEACMACLPL